MTKTKVMLTVGVLVMVFLLSLSAGTNALAQTGSPAPGLYVTDLKIDPNPPTVGNTFTFTPSFQNTANDSLTFKWRVLVYRADTPDKSYTDTAWATSSFPTGASTLLSPGDWNLPAGTPCDWYFARVVWQDDNNNEVPFTAPGGKVFEKGFNTCGVATATSPTAATPAPSSGLTNPTPAPTTGASSNVSASPGLHVSDLKMDPTPPRVGNTFTFTPSFQNTANDSLTFKWRVLVYRADTPDKSYTDTTWTTSSFPTGASTLLSPGDWNLPAGTPCDWYFARVVWQDDNNNEVPFTAPSGKVFEKGFTTCP